MTEAEELIRLAATLTNRMRASRERYTNNARRRAQVFERALALGVSGHALGRATGLHHSQIAKAIDRYGSNGS
jgi:hypothetical protein